ncbi:MAG: glycosyltransferase [Candidatus Nitrosopolaris sp.]
MVTVTEARVNSLSLRGVKNVKLATNGADCDIFKPYDKDAARSKIGFDSKDFILVYSGGIGFYYRLDIVVKALKKVSGKARNLRLLMVGYGSKIETVLDLSREEGLEKNLFIILKINL